MDFNNIIKLPCLIILNIMAMKIYERTRKIN